MMPCPGLETGGLTGPGRGQNLCPPRRTGSQVSCDRMPRYAHAVHAIRSALAKRPFAGILFVPLSQSPCLSAPATKSGFAACRVVELSTERNSKTIATAHLAPSSPPLSGPLTRTSAVVSSLDPALGFEQRSAATPPVTHVSSYLKIIPTCSQVKPSQSRCHRFLLDETRKPPAPHPPEKKKESRRGKKDPGPAEMGTRPALFCLCATATMHACWENLPPLLRCKRAASNSPLPRRCISQLSVRFVLGDAATRPEG